MHVARHFEIHAGFDLKRPLLCDWTDTYRASDFKQALADYHTYVSEDRENVRLIAVFIGDWDEPEQLILAYNYPTLRSQPKCDQCDSATINGIYCHEHGCPNRSKVYDHDEERWIDPESEED
jgi:hypothetical protein